MRYKRELNLQKTILLDCSRQHWIAEHYESKKLLLPNGQYADSGVPVGHPDLTIYIGKGIVVFAELKVGHNKQSPEQVRFQELYRARGYLCEVIYTMDQWEDYKKVIKERYFN